jgi:hypothetical protein
MFTVIFSVVIFYVAVAMRLSAPRIREHIDEVEREARLEDIEKRGARTSG